MSSKAAHVPLYLIKDKNAIQGYWLLFILFYFIGFFLVGFYEYECYMSNFSFICPRLSPASPAWQNLSLPFSIQPYSRGSALVRMRLTECPPVEGGPRSPCADSITSVGRKGDGMEVCE